MNPPSPIRVVSADCPYLKRRVYELWAGVIPVVAANAYLRSNARWKSRTVLGKARRLRVFFQFVADQGWEFWDEDVRRGGVAMGAFRNALLERCHLAPGDPAKLTFGYVDDLMFDVFDLCDSWALEDDMPLCATVTQSSRGPHGHRTRVARVRPAAFQVDVPADERHREAHALTFEDVERIWASLGAVTQPKPPAILRRHTRPRVDWPASTRAQWQRAYDDFAVALARHRRRQMLWALMITAGMRRREYPLLKRQDVRIFLNRLRGGQAELWAALKERPETRHLGEAKTGPRVVYIGFEARVVTAHQNWSESRHALVARWMARTGLPDHGMFLTTSDGGPLTGGAVAKFCAWLNVPQRGLAPFGDEGYGDGGFRLHSHAVRHTVAAMFDDWKIDRAHRKAHLGHKSDSAANAYGKQWRGQQVEALQAFDQRMREASEVRA